MSQPFADRPFVFNEHINAQYIIDLYSGDYGMIEETFTDVLNEYASLLENIDAAYQAEDIGALKKAVHKIKPLFGFAGFISIQSQCLDFEDACEATPSLRLLTTGFTALKNSLLQTRSIIEEEKERLALFNSR
jgi:HPt (histidine-containing phosphotransfer) domain-containing protein